MEARAVGARLEEALDDVLRERRLRRTDICKQAEIPDDTLSKMLSGTTLRTTVGVLDRLADLERALGLQPGYFLRKVGYVEEPGNVPEIIRSNPGLREPGKEAILVLYDHYHEDAEVRPIRRRRSKSDDAHREAASTGRTGGVTKQQAGGVKKQAEQVAPGDQP